MVFSGNIMILRMKKERDMKKIVLSLMLILSLILAGCGSEETEIVIIKPNGEEEILNEENLPADEEISEEGEIEAQIKSETEQSGELILSINPEDVWEAYGYSHFKAEKTGVYNFKPVNSEAVQWCVYLMDEEFPDAERYIPQVYDMALDGEGALNIPEGKFVYVYSTANGWTGIETPEGCICEIRFLG